MLVIAINPLAAIPREIGELSELVELHAGAYSYALSSQGRAEKAGGLVGIRGIHAGRPTKTPIWIPPQIGLLKNLKLLDLSDQRLRALPFGIGAHDVTRRVFTNQ